VDAHLIARLLRPFVEASPELIQQTSAYVSLLLKWNARINLTAVREPDEIITRHFGESLFAANRLLEPQSDETVLDIGSGAGFPGLPLAMFTPGAQVSLIEANAKKVAFLNEVISTLGLKNVRVVRERAEAYAGEARLVTMRAVESFEKTLPVAQAKVCVGGRLALLIGNSQVAWARRLANEITWGDAVPVPNSHSRVLFAGTKRVTGGFSEIPSP
jgi:16S rRNA (guanine527-N7)-methyltransferase